MLEKEIEEKAKVSEKDVMIIMTAIRARCQRFHKGEPHPCEDRGRGQKIVEQIKKGGDFAKIAKAKSMDTGSAKNGGDPVHFRGPDGA